MDIIAYAIKAGSSKSPPPGGLATFVTTLNWFSQLEYSWREDLPNAEAQQSRIRQAIYVLISEFPATRIVYEDQVARTKSRLEGGGTDYKLGRDERELGAFDRLVSAAQHAWDCGLPAEPSELRALDPTELKTTDAEPRMRPRHRWRGIAHQLEAMFHDFLPGRSKEAGYRFLEKAIPLITNEEASLGSIKEHLLTSKPSNTGSRHVPSPTR